MTDNGRNQTIDFNANGVFDIDAAVIDEGLRASVLRCIDMQKHAAQEALARFTPEPAALSRVSGDELQRIIAQGDDIHGIASDRSISNVIPFSAAHLQDAVNDGGVERLRRDVDQRIAGLVKRLFGNSNSLRVTTSGHLWYPPGAYMGWHTNSKVPGWRIYVNYAEQEARSFFRYRDSASGDIITLHDRHWNIRIFRIRAGQPLWHAVYSDTHRFSMGYMVYRDSYLARLRRRLRRLTGT